MIGINLSAEMTDEEKKLLTDVRMMAFWFKRAFREFGKSEPADEIRIRYVFLKWCKDRQELFKYEDHFVDFVKMEFIEVA